MRVLLLILAGQAVASGAAAQQTVLPLTRLSGPITLDGKLDEPAWEQIAPFPMTVYGPVFQAPLSEQTEIMVAYDERALYLGGRMWDSDPGGVRTTTLYRDQYSGDDLLSLVVDSYNDYESGVWFSTSPVGVRSDRTVANDGEFLNGSAMNNDWNAFWEVATTRTAEGWFAEMRIPFSTLGFRDEDGRVEMGLIVYRLIARKNERQVFPPIPPNWRMGFAKPSMAQRVSLERVQASKPVYVTPFVLGGVTQSQVLNPAETAYDRLDDRTGEVGLDVKYNLTNNLALDATVNTDFAQVEADSQQVNLTRFSLFFPEKRRFFQERASLFEFNTGGFSRLFHSRRIGLSDEGQQVRILGGLRLVGRMGRTDTGVLSMVTAAHDGGPAESFSVLRLRRQIVNPFSTVGAMATSRASADGDLAVSAGADATIRVVGDEYVTAKWITTFERDEPGVPSHGMLDASRLLLRWERRTGAGFGYSIDALRSGRAYLPRMGFTLRTDFALVQNRLQYVWFAGPASPIRTVTLANQSTVYLRNADRTAESAGLKPELEIEMKSGSRVTLTVENSYESVREPFLLSGAASVEAGDFWFHEGELRVSLPRAALLRGSAAVRAGTFYDGWRMALSGGPTWSVSRHLELGGSYTLNRVRFNARNVKLDSHLAAARVQVAVNVHLSATTLLQYSSVAGRMSVNGRIRYHLREGNDLWVVYNDDLNTDRLVTGAPRLPLSQNRVMMVKFTHTFGS